MSELAVFKFRNAFPVRVSDREGAPWFVAADVCKALAISNSRDAIARLDEDEHTTVAFSEPIRITPFVSVTMDRIFVTAA